MNSYLGWDLGVATFTAYDDDGFIGVQIDAFGENESGMPPFEALHPYGFASRPDDPEEDGTGCAALYFYKGNQARAMFMHDPRPMELLPNIQKGESFQYSRYGSFVRCHRDGKISIFTHDGSLEDGKSGKSIYAQVKPDGFAFVGPWGKLTFDATGLNCVHSSGASLSLGAVGGMPSPFDALATRAKLKAAMVQIESSLLSLGTSTAAEPVAKATSVLTLFTAMQTALTAIDANTTALLAYISAVATASGAGSNPGVVAAAAAASTTQAAQTAAATASAAATTAAALTIPSKSTGVS